MPLNAVWRCLLKINEVLVSEMMLQGSLFLVGLAVGKTNVNELADV